MFYFQGFTYVAPSVLEDAFKPHVIRARSPRKHSGSISFRNFNNLAIQANFAPPNYNYDPSPSVREEVMDTSLSKCF